MKKLKTWELNRIDIETFKSVEKKSYVLVLDNIRSMLNVGSVFRIADAFLAEKIILCGITAQPPHREIQKSALGATESVIWEYFKNTSEAIFKLKSLGYTILGFEQTDESTLLEDFNFNPENKFALVFGNEITGISQDVLPLLDYALEIKQFGTKHSLNVSVTAGIAAFWFSFNR